MPPQRSPGAPDPQQEPHRVAQCSWHACRQDSCPERPFRNGNAGFSAGVSRVVPCTHLFGLVAMIRCRITQAHAHAAGLGGGRPLPAEGRPERQRGMCTRGGMVAYALCQRAVGRRSAPEASAREPRRRASGMGAHVRRMHNLKHAFERTCRRGLRPTGFLFAPRETGNARARAGSSAPRACAHGLRLRYRLARIPASTGASRNPRRDGGVSHGPEAPCCSACQINRQRCKRDGGGVKRGVEHGPAQGVTR